MHFISSLNSSVGTSSKEERDGDGVNILVYVVPLHSLEEALILLSNISGSILFKCMSSELDGITEQQEKVLSVLEEKFPGLPPREEIISVLQETQLNPQGNPISIFRHFTNAVT